jgi:hypothetical protein
MIIDGKTKRPMSEDLIKYTAIGQKSAIELSDSPDVKVTEQEKIIDSKPVDSKPETRREVKYDYEYKLLTIQSEVVIINSKKQDIEMNIYKNLSGKIKNVTIDYTNKIMPSNNINQQNKLKFNQTIKAGQTIRFTYTYEKYVREN